MEKQQRLDDTQIESVFQRTLNEIAKEHKLSPSSHQSLVFHFSFKQTFAKNLFQEAATVVARQ